MAFVLMVPPQQQQGRLVQRSILPLQQISTVALSSTATETADSTAATATTSYSFIDSELRGAAMRLHTKEQAPQEGQAPSKETTKKAPPTHADYLQYLIDSQYVYATFEELVEQLPELEAFRQTGLERTTALRHDVDWMMDVYFPSSSPQKTQMSLMPSTTLTVSVGAAGLQYADVLQQLRNNIPALVCHYYNFYFAHTAGGRMIGQAMKKQLFEDVPDPPMEFYKVCFGWSIPAFQR